MNEPHSLRPPQSLFADSAVFEDANYLRFHFSPRSMIALGAWVKRAGKAFVGDQREFRLLDEAPMNRVRASGCRALLRRYDSQRRRRSWS